MTCIKKKARDFTVRSEALPTEQFPFASLHPKQLVQEARLNRQLKHGRILKAQCKHNPCQLAGSPDAAANAQSRRLSERFIHRRFSVCCPPDGLSNGGGCPEKAGPRNECCYFIGCSWYTMFSYYAGASDAYRHPSLCF